MKILIYIWIFGVAWFIGVIMCESVFNEQLNSFCKTHSQGLYYNKFDFAIYCPK